MFTNSCVKMQLHCVLYCLSVVVGVVLTSPAGQPPASVPGKPDKHGVGGRDKVDLTTHEGAMKYIKVLENEMTNLRSRIPELEDRLAASELPTDCAEVLRRDPSAVSGIYEINPQSCSNARVIEVWCDMDTAGGIIHLIFIYYIQWLVI